MLSYGLSECVAVTGGLTCRPLPTASPHRVYTHRTGHALETVMRIIVVLLLCASVLPLFGKHRILLNRIGPSGAELFIANADGSAERSLLAAPGFDYNASFSPDGKWIVFTSERGGSADIYRGRADGTGLERLTDDPA